MKNSARTRLARAMSATASLALALAVALLLLALVEGGLRAAGYGVPTALFVRDDTASPAVWRDNQAFVRRFFPGPWFPDTAPAQLAAAPPANELRVAVFGESAAYGYPDPAFGFARMIEAMLETDYPDRAVSLINAAVSGLSSPCIVEALRDVLPLKPDVLVFYIGNNEFIGPFGASNRSTSGDFSSMRIRANVLSSRLRLTQWLGAAAGAAEGPAPAATTFTPRAVSVRDAAVPRTHQRFETNLRAMLDLAAEAGVPVVLCTVAVNLKDWPPCGDTHRPGLSPAERAAWDETFAAGETAFQAGTYPAALQAWKQAETIDDEPASLAYALGKAHAAAGDPDAAMESFKRACEQDAIRYRCSPAMNSLIRRIAEEYAVAPVRLADCAARLEQELESDPAPPRYFYDSCHLSFEGNVAVANCVRDALTKSLDPPAAQAPLSRDGLAKRLGWTPWHARENLLYVKKLTDKPPYNARRGHDTWATALETDIAALEAHCTPAALGTARAELEAQAAQHPADLFLARGVAQLLDAEGDHHGAAERLDALVAAFPRYDAAWVLLARARRAAGDFPQATAAWRTAYALRPDRQDWRVNMCETLFAGGDYTAARAEWQDIARHNPASEQAWWRIGGTYEQEKNYPEAVAAYREGLTHLPGNPGLYYYLAKALMAQGASEEARAATQEGLSFSPDHEGLKGLAAALTPAAQ